MARIIDNNEPVEPKYSFEFTLSEINAINSVLLDLSDPLRKVVIDYTFDESRVVPTDRAYAKIAAVAQVLEAATQEHFDDYLYDDWFVKAPDEED